MISWLFDSLAPFVQLLLVSVGLYLAPGLAILGIAWPLAARPLRGAERFALAIGISLALPPVLLYAFRLLGLTWSATATQLYVAIAVLVWLVPMIRDRARRPHPRSLFSLSRHWDLWLLIGITMFALVIRLYAVRDFRAGLFGDSVHHTMIVQLLLDNGGLFTSWEPYAPLASFTYHFGFHANVAFYSWLTGMPSTLSLLIIGQVLNAVSAPMAFLLVARLVRQTDTSPSYFPVASIAGTWAAALTAFASIMPMFYTNWGRYTQLAGQLLLVATLVLWVELVEHASERRTVHAWPVVALAALLTSSLMLTHYIITIFAALMVVAYIVANIVRYASVQSAIRIVVPSTIGAGIALAFALPWIRNTLTSGLSRNVTTLGNGTVSAERLTGMSTLGPITPTYLTTWMLVLASAGVFIALAQRRWRVAMLAIWTGLMIATVTPQTFGLPGTGIIDQFTAYIALYVTVLPLCGYAVAALHEWLALRGPLVPSKNKAALHAGATALAVVLMGAWGASWLPRTIEPNRQMLTVADERAMAWIREHVPAEARFAVNTFPAYAGTLIAGTDGGWWIALLTRRSTTLPPMTYGSEKFERADFYKQTNGLAQSLRGRALPDGRPVTVTLTTPENVQLLRNDGVTHIYIGANAIPGPDVVDHIDANALRQSNAFHLIYDQDGVSIFELVK